MTDEPASGTPRALIVGDGDTFEVDGRRFKLEVRRDDCLGEPWKEFDLHGVVSDWTSRKKRPGERVLNEDRGSYRYYDTEATMVLALKDWIDSEPVLDGKTRGQRAAIAVNADFEYLRRWCNNEWEWVYLKVTLLDGRDKGDYEAVSGICSEEREYISETAHELAHQLLERVVTNGGQHG